MAGGDGRLLARSFAALLALSVGATCRSAAAQAPAAKPSPAATGQLKMEGLGVERITLERCEGRSGLGEYVTVVPDASGRAVSVPAGEYRLHEIALKGGYSCQRPIANGLAGVGPYGEWLTISPEKPCLLKVGGPLKPAVGARRQGRTVQIWGALRDAGGREYFRRDAGTLPRFTVYRDHQIVASRSFEYG